MSQAPVVSFIIYPATIGFACYPSKLTSSALKGKKQKIIFWDPNTQLHVSFRRQKWSHFTGQLSFPSSCAACPRKFGASLSKLTRDEDFWTEQIAESWIPTVLFKAKYSKMVYGASSTSIVLGFFSHKSTHRLTGRSLGQSA